MKTICALGAACFAAISLTGAAEAATFNFTVGGAAGTFDAPEGGGAITALSVTLGGTVFDMLDAGAFAPVYNPVLNMFSGIVDVEFTGAGATSAAIYNSAASAACPAGVCVLQLFATSGGTQPPEFLAFNMVTFENIAFGFYAIDPSPVPLPAPLLLLGAGLAGLGLARRRAPAVA